MRLEYLILGLLSLRPASGYSMHKWLNSGNGQYIGYRAQLPQVYRALAKLAERNWVVFDTDETPGRPDAKVYRLTELGRDELLNWANSPYEPTPRPMDPDFMLRFIFGGQFGPGIAINVLRTELEYRRRQADAAKARGFGQELDPIPDIDISWARKIHLIARDREYVSAVTYIAWLETTLARLEIEAAELAGELAHGQRHGERHKHPDPAALGDHAVSATVSALAKRRWRAV
jgi:DNA-binding PadR family transcriptional regulator